MKKIITIFIFLALCSELFSQSTVNTEPNPEKKAQWHLEYGLVPLLLFNQADLGIGYMNKNKSIEQVFVVTMKISLVRESIFNLSLNYNSNFYFKDHKSYIPVWTRASNSRRGINYEDGYFPHTLRFALGTGFGRKFKLRNKVFLKAEAGAGLSLNLTSNSGAALPYYFAPSDYGFDNHYTNRNPKISPAFKVKFTLVSAFCCKK